jgi:hypothetical protein
LLSFAPSCPHHLHQRSVTRMKNTGKADLLQILLGAIMIAGLSIGLAG